MTATEILKQGTRAVAITEQDGRVWANLYVNARGEGINGADITLSRWQGKTLTGAIRWANKQLG